MLNFTKIDRFLYRLSTGQISLRFFIKYQPDNSDTLAIMRLNYLMVLNCPAYFVDIATD